ncbi:MAG: hypothetical protein AAFR39_14325 [Pseudomonadota bacterium]
MRLMLALGFDYHPNQDASIKQKGLLFKALEGFAGIDLIHGAADRKNLEPSEGLSSNSNLPAQHTNLDSNSLSKTFAEMESWSDVLRNDPVVMEVLRSSPADKEKPTQRSSLRRAQTRGPSR